MTYTTCGEDIGEFVFTPDYPDGSTTFSIESGYTWVEIDDTTGEVTADIGGIEYGDYVVIIKYSLEGGDTTIAITISIEDCTISLLENSFSMCINSGTYEQQVYLSDGSLTGYSIDSPIDGVTISDSGLLTIDTNEITAGTYSMNIKVGDGTYPFDLLILACTAPPTNELTECDKEPIGIVWVNQEGGRQSYWFNQPKEYDINQSNGKTYINSSKEKRYYSRGRVEYGVNIKQDFVPLLHLDSLNSLKNSIQAWSCTDLDDINTYKSIIIDEDSWIFRKTQDRFYTIEFSFKYSIAKPIQRQ